METWHIEVDGYYFDDVIISIKDNVSDAVDTAIDLAQDTLGGSVRGFYLNTDINLISLSMGLWRK